MLEVEPNRSKVVRQVQNAAGTTLVVSNFHVLLVYRPEADPVFFLKKHEITQKH